MPDKNHLAQIFEEIALLLGLADENQFKVRAYETAARSLRQLEGNVKDLVNSGEIAAVKGIGKALTDKITEYVNTGKISYLAELQASIPKALLELITIPGLGPQKALVLYEKLGINSIGELEYACKENRLIALSGFGEKSQNKLLKSIENMKKFKGHFLLGETWPLAEKITEYLQEKVQTDKVAVVGSIRRRMEVVNDIDIVMAGENLTVAYEAIHSMPGAAKVENIEENKFNIYLTNGMKVTILIVDTDKYFTSIHYYTGSFEFNAAFAEKAKKQGFSLTAEGLFQQNKQVLIHSEKEIYALMHLQFIEPELRENADNLEPAVQNKLPDLIELKNVKGVFHVHTLYSDGSASVAEMADGAVRKGWNYIGITDHSKSAGYARGLKVDAIYGQRREIEQLNALMQDITIFAGIECDILADGSLDYTDDVLEQFDFVIASVHSSFQQSESDMTRRIIKAMQNKYVSIIGHPTGRILLARDEYNLNMRELIAEAANTGTIIEINASPYRLDLDWRWHRLALENNIMLAINPDAHGVDELNNVKYGVAAARKGGLEAKNIVNTFEAKAALNILRRKRNNKLQ